MSGAVTRTCGCGAPATFELTRSHDGGGRTFTCDAHLPDATRSVAASVPSWATYPSTRVTTRTLTS